MVNIRGLILCFRVISLLFLTTRLLRILITIEIIRLSLFLIIIYYFNQEGIKEIIIYFVIIVGEALLGLVLIVIKVLLRGDDILFAIDVI